MDSCDWSEERYNEIKDEMTKMIQQAGFKPRRVPFIPYSGFHGENLIQETDKMPWYKGWKANISKDEVAEGKNVIRCIGKVGETTKTRRF